MISVEIAGTDDINVFVRVSGRYSPDILDDVKARAVATFREAVAAQAGVEWVNDPDTVDIKTIVTGGDAATDITEGAA